MLMFKNHVNYLVVVEPIMMMMIILHICCSRTGDRMRKFALRKEIAALSCPLGFLLHPDARHHDQDVHDNHAQDDRDIDDC